MNTQTGTIKLVYAAPAVIPDANAPDGSRTEDQLNLTIRLSADEREYQHTIPIREDTIALGQLEEWQAKGQQVTVFSSSVRAIPFVHDNSKDKDGVPIKKYQRPGRKVTVDKVPVELDAFLVFQSYDVRLAGQVTLDQEAQQAHADYLKRQAEYQRRQVEARVAKARERAKERQAELKAKAQAERATEQKKSA